MFWVLDYRATFPIMLLMLFPGMYMLAFTVAMMVFFWFIGTRGYTVPVFLRMMRSLLAGRRRIAKSILYKRRMYDGW